MDSSAKFKQLLEAMQSDPEQGKPNLQVILNKLKSLRDRLDLLNDEELSEGKVIKLLEEDMQPPRLTWTPTFYEYIVFYVMVAIVLVIFGKSTRSLAIPNTTTHCTMHTTHI